MGWGMLYNVEMEISKKTYTSIYEVQEEIKDIEHSLEKTKSRLKIMVALDPSKLPIDEGMDITYYISNEIDDMTEYLTEDMFRLQKLYYLLKIMEEEEKNNVPKEDSKIIIY